MICDNCGHEEDTGLGDAEFEEEENEFIEEEEEDELNDMFLNEDTSDSFEEVEEPILPTVKETEEEEVPWQTTETPEEMNAIREDIGTTKIPLGVIDPSEPGAGSHNPDNPEPVKELHTEDLFSLEEEVTPIQTMPEVKAFNQKIVDFAGKFYAGSELESSNIVEKDTFTVVELNTNELFVL
jgi:hypothetical protein